MQVIVYPRAHPGSHLAALYYPGTDSGAPVVSARLANASVLHFECIGTVSKGSVLIPAEEISDVGFVRRNDTV